ncbi:MAG: hypothetical protein F2599_04165 [Actinobacteria bacterium]|uniref:Unannotated protein n=1 Tax=freshwater metagenome TaxID=449393 RepID=A0A6J6IIB4_9ZZZZ|nr:hypothetical protein [Actinomycetota bacterium]
MNAKWTQILAIWALVAIVTISLVVYSPPEVGQVEASFGAILAGSIATVSLLQLFKNNADGFVRKLIYVGGGSYLILALATAYIFLNG